eukprot:5147059-Amphidinium_carterae.2
MAYVDDLLVVGDNVAAQQFLQQFQQHVELKHTTQLTRSTPLEFLGKTVELMDNGTINLSFSVQYCNKIVRAYNLEKCKPSTVPGNPNCCGAFGQRAPLNVQDSSWTTTLGITITCRPCICRERA